MNTKVSIQDEYYTILDVNQNPNNIYVFGDNLIEKGCGGQAIIRYCSNSFGIPTKRLPTMDFEAFFRDRDEEFISVNLKIKELVELSKTHTIVFPKDGIGTGLAAMPKSSPKLFQYLCDKIEEHFGLIMTDKGFI